MSVRSLMTLAAAMAPMDLPPHGFGHQRYQPGGELRKRSRPLENPAGTCDPELRAARKERRSAKQRLRARRGRR